MQGFEVLHCGGEEELVARAGKTAQPHALEAVVGLQVGKARLDTFNPSEFKPGEAIASNPEEGDRDRREYGDVGGYAEV